MEGKAVAQSLGEANDRLAESSPQSDRFRPEAEVAIAKSQDAQNQIGR